MSTEAQTCVKCGAVSRSKSNIIQVALGVFLVIGFIAYMFGGGVEKSVASDSLQQYEISKRNGDLMEICVHAGLVTAAYLQAHDEVAHKKWLQIQDADCRRAGLPTLHTP